MWSLIGWLSVIVIAGAVAYSGFFFYRIAIKRAPKVFLSTNRDLKANPPVAGASWGEGQNWISSQKIQNVEILSADGLKLRAYMIPSSRAEGHTVIIAHGYSGKGKDMGAYAKIYAELLGYNVLIPDARGHGESEGNYIGFGWHERRDYLQWIRYLIDRKGPESKIVLHGVSMGGATVLMTSGEDLPPQVKVIVSDCAYTSVKAQLSYQLRRMYRLPGFPFVNSASLVTRLKAGYSFGEASALKQVQKAKVPILFIHGDADTFVPFSMMNELYEACRSPKEQFIVQGAGHGTSYDRDKTGYVSRVTNFVTKYM
ncbi:alpha/beta hydrolase [Paenibacillus wynnii]|uniref:alpha/beta hydrolase n=1 Tax=Paenibacillus wynnii TaxID=268407 RepID=UPI003593582C